MPNTYIFASRVPQRGDASGKFPGAESPCSNLVGPGSYSPSPGCGHPFYTPWLREPLRKSGTFASKTQKTPLPRSLTADVDHGGDGGINARYLKRTQGDVPGSRAQAWPRGERKPPHFHVPFRAYPSMGGDPRGRSPGLDQFYELDTVVASRPGALHGTLTVNMERTARVYAPVFKSNAPVRANGPGSGGGDTSEFLGPGAYNLDRSGIKIKEPRRHSSGFMRPTGGMYHNVGGPRGDGGQCPMKALPVARSDPRAHPLAVPRGEA